jgi:hypothetical protein
VSDNLMACVRQDGRLYLKEKPGRRTLDIKAFEKVYPEAFRRLQRLSIPATIGDAE